MDFFRNEEREREAPAELPNAARANESTRATDVPLAAQTEIHNESTGLSCLMEYPIKTMNISIDTNAWRVDTGPIAFPNLSRRYDPLVESVSLAFAAFNAPHFCDFVIEQPTPVIRDEHESCKVYHYSNPVSLVAKNRVLAVA